VEKGALSQTVIIPQGKSPRNLFDLTPGPQSRDDERAFWWSALIFRRRTGALLKVERKIEFSTGNSNWQD